MPDPAPELRRGIGIRDGILLTIGSMVGSGIFLTPGAVATAVPHGGLLLLTWLLGGLLTLAGALTLAELGVLFPRAGGQYHFLKEAYGPLPGFLFDFQAHLVAWALRKGRSAIFADCGLGKTPMQLAWAQQVVERENRPVLVLAPLSVSQQTVEEAEKFGIEAARWGSARATGARIVLTNYERLHHFDPEDFAGGEKGS